MRCTHGIALDTDAERSCVGLAQAKAYAAEQGLIFRLISSRRSFTFGDTVLPSLGLMKMTMPTPSGILSLDLDVVKPNIPALLGLDLMDAHGVQFLTVTNQLQSVAKGWHIPVVWKLGHGYIRWGPLAPVLFPRSELARLHRPLYHPSTTKLLNLLRRADADKVTAETRSMLQDIRAACHACQIFVSRPVTFQILTPDEGHKSGPSAASGDAIQHHANGPGGIRAPRCTTQNRNGATQTTSPGCRPRGDGNSRLSSLSIPREA
jgi:hypothetical protein